MQAPVAPGWASLVVYVDGAVVVGAAVLAVVGARRKQGGPGGANRGGLAAAALSSGISPLSEREREVLVAGQDGATIAEIAKMLFLSEGTVRNYLSSAIQKLEVNNRTEAARVAEDQGWL